MQLRYKITDIQMSYWLPYQSQYLLNNCEWRKTVIYLSRYSGGNCPRYEGTVIIMSCIELYSKMLCFRIFMKIILLYNLNFSRLLEKFWTVQNIKNILYFKNLCYSYMLLLDIHIAYTFLLVNTVCHTSHKLTVNIDLTS